MDRKGSMMIELWMIMRYVFWARGNKLIDAHLKSQCHERKVTSGNKETTNWTLAALLRIVTFMPILIILSRGICMV